MGLVRLLAVVEEAVVAIGIVEAQVDKEETEEETDMAAHEEEEENDANERHEGVSSKCRLRFFLFP